MIKNLFLILGSLFIVNNIHAENTYVICATKDKKWDWLKENGDYVTVSGQWKTAQSGYNYYSYFKLKDNTNINDLKNKCIEKFGISYIFIQPASNIYDDWMLFEMNEQFLKGIMSFTPVYDIGHFYNSQIKKAQ